MDFIWERHSLFVLVKRWSQLLQWILEKECSLHRQAFVPCIFPIPLAPFSVPKRFYQQSIIIFFPLWLQTGYMQNGHIRAFKLLTFQIIASVSPLPSSHGFLQHHHVSRPAHCGWRKRRSGRTGLRREKRRGPAAVRRGARLPALVFPPLDWSSSQSAASLKTRCLANPWLNIPSIPEEASLHWGGATRRKRQPRASSLRAGRLQGTAQSGGVKCSRPGLSLAPLCKPSDSEWGGGGFYC